MDAFFKALMIIAILVAILAMIEKLITTNLYRQRYSLNKNSYIKILIPGIPLPCYIYRAKQCACLKDIPPELRAIYEKRIIPVHISHGIKKRLIKTKNSAEGIFTTGSPINSIVKTVSNGMGLINDSDPTQSETDARWKILKPIGYTVKCFVDGYHLYIM